MGLVSIDASLSVFGIIAKFPRRKFGSIFCLIFVVEIQQRFTSGVLQHSKCYSHQAFTMRIQQQGCPIFTTKIWQSFVFGELWRVGRVLCLCIRRVPTCSCQDELEPLKAFKTLICVTYTGKPMSLGDMDRDGHTTMTMHTVRHEYAPTANALITYSCHKVKSTHGQRWLLIQP